MKIHAIGDSHTGAFAFFDRNGKQIDYYSIFPFVAHYIAGATAHNLANPKSSSQSKGKFSQALSHVKKEEDIILLWFGEIDCRFHIPNEEGIPPTIKNYGIVLKNLHEAGYKFAVMSMPPANHDSGNIPPVVRAKTYRLFNKYLKAFCDENNYPYVDVYTPAVDDKGFMQKRYLRNDTHFKNNIIPLVINSLLEQNVISLEDEAVALLTDEKFLDYLNLIMKAPHAKG